MGAFRWLVSVALLAGAAQAADVDVRVIVSSDVRPGVYGRVDFGGAPPPPLVYTRPVTVVRVPPRPVPVQPVYLQGEIMIRGMHGMLYSSHGPVTHFKVPGFEAQLYQPRYWKG